MSASVPAEGPGKRLGRDVRDRRRALGLRQQDVADIAGASVRFVRELELGKESVRLDKMRAVLDALGLDLRAIVRRTGDES